jgi:hypothetical protein
MRRAEEQAACAGGLTGQADRPSVGLLCLASHLPTPTHMEIGAGKVR